MSVTTTLFGAVPTDSDHYIFVTSTAHDGNLGGLAGADALCASHAAGGSLTGPLNLTWKALLSVYGVVDARDRVNWVGAVYDVAGNLATNNASSWPWVADGTSVIGIDENGDPPPDSYVWTGSHEDGVSVGPGYDCNGWTNNTSAHNGWAGETEYFGYSNWFDSFGNQCGDAWFSLYCVSIVDIADLIFEDGFEGTIEPPNCIAGELSCGGSISSNLDENDCTEGPLGSGHYAEAYTYAGLIGDRLFIDASWGFDGYLLLEGPSGLIVAENDNYTGSGDSRIEYEVMQDGTYTLWASSFAAGATGSFELSLACDAPDGPDLTVDAPSVPGGILVPGQAITVRVTLRNIGNAGADSTTLRYLLSSDATITLADTQIGADGAAALAAGAESVHERVLTAPNTAGTLWIGVCADAVAGEASTSNNCSPARQIVVAAAPTCQVSSLSCGGQVSGSLNLSDCTDSPRGAGFLAEVLEVNATLDESLVFDAAWGGLDGYLILEDPSGRVVAENDDAGSGAFSRIEYRVVQAGTHRLWVTSYQRNAQGNYSVELTCGASTAPDLVASPVTLHGDPILGPLEMSATVTNVGGSAAAATTVDFMLSTDAEITPADTWLTAVSLASLGPGMSETVSAQVAAPSTPGNYWVGICVWPVAGEVLTGNNCSHLEETPP